jgi:hypothetical protein
MITQCLGVQASESTLLGIQDCPHLWILWTLGLDGLNELDLGMTFLVKEGSSECRPWAISLAFEKPRADTCYKWLCSIGVYWTLAFYECVLWLLTHDGSPFF